MIYSPYRTSRASISNHTQCFCLEALTMLKQIKEAIKRVKKISETVSKLKLNKKTSKKLEELVEED